MQNSLLSQLRVFHKIGRTVKRIVFRAMYTAKLDNQVFYKAASGCSRPCEKTLLIRCIFVVYRWNFKKKRTNPLTYKPCWRKNRIKETLSGCTVSIVLGGRRTGESEMKCEMENLPQLQFFDMSSQIAKKITWAADSEPPWCRGIRSLFWHSQYIWYIPWNRPVLHSVHIGLLGTQNGSFHV